MNTNISNNIKYIGVNDHFIDLFEGQYTVPNGMSYNSYVIIDEKIAVTDTVDAHFTHEWLKNLENTLDGRTPDYLIVHHMEPDHSAGIKAFAEKLANSFVDALDVDDDEKEDTRKDVLDTLKSVVFGDLTVTFVIKDGYFTDITLEMKGLSVDVDDSDNIEDEDISIITGAIGMFTVDFNMNFKCNSRGKEVTITPPSDLDEYEEYSFDIDDIFPPVDF